MNPQVGQPQNPFMSMLTKLQSQGAPQAPGQNNPGIEALLQRLQNPGGGATSSAQPGGAPIGAPQGVGQGAGMPGVQAQQPDIEDAAIPGKNPGVSKNLLGAMNQLHGAITQMTDPQEIRMIRAIIVLLTNLIQRDQEVQNTRTGTMAPQQAGQSSFGGGEGAPPAGMPNGQPTGQPSPSM